jgi:hypothetical protein
MVVELHPSVDRAAMLEVAAEDDGGAIDPSALGMDREQVEQGLGAVQNTTAAHPYHASDLDIGEFRMHHIFRIAAGPPQDAGIAVATLVAFCARTTAEAVTTSENAKVQFRYSTELHR